MTPTEQPRLSNSEREALQDALLAVFATYGLNVGVGLIRGGVAIRSQDERVDAANLGTVTAYEHPGTQSGSEEDLTADRGMLG